MGHRHEKAHVEYVNSEHLICSRYTNLYTHLALALGIVLTLKGSDVSLKPLVL
jgi:hypothetical protein